MRWELMLRKLIRERPKSLRFLRGAFGSDPFHRQARLFPCVDSTVEVVNRFDLKFLKRRQARGASATGSAVDEVAFVFVEVGDALLKISRAEVDVRRARDVARLEFFRRANVQDHRSLFCNEWLCLFR